MNVRFLIVLVLAVTAALGLCQEPTAQQKAVDAMLTKVRKIEVYNQILPVLMTPDQIRAILTVLEKHRVEAAKLEDEEFKWLSSVDKDLTTLLKNAEEKGAIPDEKTMETLVLYFKAFSIKRAALMNEVVAELKKTMKEKLNAGQVSAAANALDVRFYAFTKPAEELTEDEKLDSWIRVVLLDNHAYYILLELAKKK